MVSSRGSGGYAAPNDDTRDLSRPGSGGSFDAVATRSLNAGEMVGRYVIAEQLGVGGMGVVYRARDPSLDRDVAIKVVKAVGQPGAQSRMLEEARAMAALSHPNLLPVYDVGEYSGGVYIAMELVSGSTLRQWLSREDPALDRILEVFVAAGRGLAAAHATGLVHRDFKPTNVLVGHDRRVRVMDFGLTRPVGREDESTPDFCGDHRRTTSNAESDSEPLTAEGSLLGTPSYLAPELFRDRPADVRSDQFAFAVSLYEAIVGNRPWTGRQLRAHAEGVPGLEMPSPPTRRDLPGPLWKAISKGLSPDRADRFPSMDALLDAIALAPRSRRRMRRLAAATALVSVASVGVYQRAHSGGAERSCSERVDARLADGWNSSARSDISDAFERSGLRHSVVRRRHTLERLDRYAVEWTDRSVAACESAEQAFAGSLEADCLEGRLAEFAALVDALRAADATGIENALSSTSALVPVQRCAQTPIGLTDPTLPRDTATHEATTRVRALVAASEAQKNSGDLELALSLADRAVDTAERSSMLPLVAAARLHRADVHEARGDHDLAASDLERTFFWSRENGFDATATKSATRLVSVYATGLAQLDEAQKWQQHAQGLVDQAEEAPLYRARLEIATASILDEEGRYEEAAEALQSARSTLERVLGSRDPLVGVASNNLGNVLGSLGRFAEAREAYEQSLAISEANQGPDHPDVARDIGNIGTAFYEQGDFEGALHHYRRSLQMLNAAVGAAPADRARALSNLGNALWRLGRHDEALDPGLEALEYWRTTLGESHPQVAVALGNVGNVHDARGDYERSLVYYQRGLAVWERALGPEHPNVAMMATNVANAMAELGRSDEAIAMHRRALEIFEATLGPEHGSSGGAWHNIGWVLQRRGDFQAAQSHFERALEIRLKALPADHPDIAQSERSLAKVRDTLE